MKFFTMLVSVVAAMLVTGCASNWIGYSPGSGGTSINSDVSGWTKYDYNSQPKVVAHGQTIFVGNHRGRVVVAKSEWGVHSHNHCQPPAVVIQRQTVIQTTTVLQPLGGVNYSSGTVINNGPVQFTPAVEYAPLQIHGGGGPAIGPL